MRKLLLTLLLTLPLAAQTYNLAPAFAPQFLDNNGLPLANGFIYTCVAGASCPGSPLATYTDSTGAILNANPIPLNASGRPSNGVNVVGIWMTAGVSYKFVLTSSVGVIIQTVDNLQGSSGGGGGSGTNYWTLSGNDIYNNNGASAGNVNVQGNLFVGGNSTPGISGSGYLITRSGIQLQDASGLAFAVIRAPNCMGTGSCSETTTVWRWAPTDAAGCLESDGLGNLSFMACGGSGGSAVGPLGSIQYSNGSGSFLGTSNAAVDSSGDISLGGGAGNVTINASTGVITVNPSTGGLNVTADPQFNSIQTVGGLYANLAGYSGAGAGGQAGMTVKANASQSANLITLADSSNTTLAAFDSVANLSIPGLTMSAITGSAQCLHVNTSGVVSGTGSDCGGSGSSPGSPSTGIQYNNGGVFAATASATLNSAGDITLGASGGRGQILITGTGGGLDVTGTFNYNSIQTLGGYLSALSDPTQAGLTINANSGQTAHLVNIDNSAGTPQAWFDSTYKLTTPGITISAITGLTQCLQVGSTGIVSGTGAACGSGSAGVTSLNTLAGALSIAGTANEISVTPSGTTITLATPQPIATSSTPTFAGVVANGPFNSTVNGGNIGFEINNGSFSVTGNGTIQLNASVSSLAGLNVINSTAANSIQTSGGMQAAGEFSSTASGANIAFGTSGTVAIYGSGLINTVNSINANGATSQIQITSNTAATSINTVGGITTATGSAFNGGFTTSSSSNSILYIGTGNFYDRYTGGASTAVSCSGISNGWMAVTSDDYVVVCLGGSRFRSALASF